MHPINKWLSHFGMQLSRTKGLMRFPREFMAGYERNLAELKRNSEWPRVIRDLHYDIGAHPDAYVDFECAFAASHLSARNPRIILDVGSYRHFILGLLAHFHVTTIDIRPRKSAAPNELVVTCDAKQLNLADDSFDIVLSLCVLEHFGLGRYGDEFDLDADKKAFREMIRVLKPGGQLIFTTAITRAQPSLCFNAHRIYSYPMIRALCADSACVDEKFYSLKMQASCSMGQVTEEVGRWDLYCGCWEKT